MLYNMYVPKHFWGAVLTVFSLINYMPSIVLHNQSLFSLLYPHYSRFPLPPHVFGCMAFAHVLDPDQDKLSPYTRKCLVRLCSYS